MTKKQKRSNHEDNINIFSVPRTTELIWFIHITSSEFFLTGFPDKPDCNNLMVKNFKK